MRLVALLFLPCLVLGCGCEQEQPPKPVVKPEPKPPAMPMSQATWGRIRFVLPTAWKEKPRVAADGRQIIFDGPRDQGEPTVSLFWVESKRTLDQWAEFMRKKYDTPGGPALVVDKGWGSVGSKRAYFMIYELQQGEIAVGPKGGSHVTIDYYFQHDGHVGFLRCTCLKKYFANVYRPLFTKISNLQFLPAPR